MFGSGSHPKPSFGCLHGDISFVRGYLKTWDVHDTQTLISLSFLALPWIKLRFPSEHHNHSSHCSYDSDGSPLWSPTAVQVVDIQSTGSSWHFILCITISGVHLISSFRPSGIEISRICLDSTFLWLITNSIVCCHKTKRTLSRSYLFDVLDLRGAWSSLHRLETRILNPG